MRRSWGWAWQKKLMTAEREISYPLETRGGLKGSVFQTLGKQFDITWKRGGRSSAPVIIFTANRLAGRYYIILRHTFNPYSERAGRRNSPKYDKKWGALQVDMKALSAGLHPLLVFVLAIVHFLRISHTPFSPPLTPFCLCLSIFIFLPQPSPQFCFRFCGSYLSRHKQEKRWSSGRKIFEEGKIL